MDEGQDTVEEFGGTAARRLENDRAGMAEDGASAIHVERLGFRYRQSTFELDIPSLTVQPGETVAVIGPSGSGKTTLLNLIAGILTPESGRVVTSGTELSRLTHAARRRFRIRHLGLVFQEFELLDHLHVADNILLPARLAGSIKVDDSLRDRAADLARKVGLGDKLRRYVRRLSQGERQRVALCRALLLRPPVLLCDEPTGNLDPVNKEQVLDLMFEYLRQRRTTLLAVTHDHDVLPRFDRTIDFKSFYATAGATG